MGWAIVGGHFWAVGRPTQALGSPLKGICLYYGVVLFSLGITPPWIGKRALLWAGILVHVAVFLVVYALKITSVTRGGTDELPGVEGGCRDHDYYERRKRLLSE